MQALRQVVSPLGVFNCPAHRGEEKAKLGESALWAEASQGQEATADLLSSFDASHECREGTCLYNPANHLIESLIEDDSDLSESFPSLPDRGDGFL